MKKEHLSNKQDKSRHLLSVIIPVYNEKRTVLEIIKRIKKVKINKEIILVDDYSKDGTREILKKIKARNIHVLFHDKNYGKGHAIRTGLKKVSGDMIIIQDADLEYNPADYLKLVKPVIEGKAKVVYGSRNLGKGKHEKSSLSFYLGGVFLSKLANFLYGTRITDEATCYKLFRNDVIKNLNLKCEKFEFCPEVTAKIARRRIPIIEIPISYHPRNIKEGKKIRWADGVEAIWTLIKYRFVK